MTAMCAALLPPPPANSLWANIVPVTPDAHDAGSLELGLQFRSSVNGSISAIKFYKSSGSTSPHSVSLWSGAGTRLAGPVNSTSETASGWQTVALTAPVSITAGVTYVASYHTVDYAVDDVYTWPFTSSPLTGTAGIYRYGAASVFPNQIYMASNYWVDIVFAPH